MNRTVRRVLAAATGLAVAAVAAAAVVVGHPPAAHADAAGKGGDYVPLARSATLLDTRNGTGAPAGARGANSTTTVQVLGRATVPATGVSAVMVDLTAVAPSAATYLTAWASGTPRPANSMLNPRGGGVTISNGAVVPVGADGKINVFNSAGTTHLMVDVQGYFLTNPSTAAGGFVPVPHTRIVDTRSGLGTPKAKIPQGGSVTITIGTGSPIPANASAAFLNLVVVGATTASWLAAYPAGGTFVTSSFDYPTGTASSAAAVKLSADGRITIKNQGAPIDLVIEAQGYFSADPAVGAGLRPALTRLHDTRTTGTPIPANGTLDVAIGGTNGLPTRNIAGAVLGLTTIASAAGILVAWPTGGTQPGAAVSNFPGGETRAATAVVRPGVEGKVTIRNASGSPVNVVVDLEGWFAEPLPPAPAPPFPPSAGIQAVDAAGRPGPLEFAYVNNIGQLVHGRIGDPDVLSDVAWTVVSDGQAFSGTPALAQQPDRRVHLAAQHLDSNVWARTQSAVGGPEWSGWGRMGGSMAASPAVGRLPDGTLVQFAVDADGRLWHLRQGGPNGAYGSWRGLGDADLVGTPTVVTLENALQLVALDAAGAVRTATYFVDGGLSAWTSLGGTGLTGTPAAVVYPGFRLRVFVRGADGAVLTKAQDGGGAFPADWTPVGEPVAAGSPAAVLNPATARTEVIVRGPGGSVLLSRETAQGSGQWEPWFPLPMGGATAATDPTVLTYTNSNGSTYLFAARDADNVFRVWIPGPSDPRDAQPGYAGTTLPEVTS